MDITRMVHAQHSDETPEPIDGVVIWPTIPTERAVARSRPQRPRKPTAERLRAKVDALDLVMKHLPNVLRDLGDLSDLSDLSDLIDVTDVSDLGALGDTLASNSAANSTDSDHEQDNPVKRIRAFLMRTILLAEKGKKERMKIIEHLRLLKRHHEGIGNLRRLLRGLRLDKWHWICERWRTLTEALYEPIPESKSDKIMQETFHAIKTHKHPEGKNGADAFGWSDVVHLDDDSHYVRFMTSKTQSPADAKQLADLAWSIYSDGDLYKKYHHGDNCDFFLQVIQQISPDVMVIQTVEKFPDLVQMTHLLALVFRVQTETGYMIVCRSIESPQLQRLMKSDGLSLSGSFFWDTFDVAHRDAEGNCDAVRYTLAGSIGSDNPTYARRACDEILIALLRCEAQLSDTRLLPIESPTDDGNDTTSDSQALQASR